MNSSSFSNFRRPFVANDIVFLDEVGSTNDYAKELGASGALHGTAVIAAKQTSGKGRLGRAWDGGVAKDIYLSILLRPKFEPTRLTLMTAVCVCHVLNEILGPTSEKPARPKALIKWPNDIVADGKKICGILAESGAYGVVLGIGINVFRDSFPPELAQRSTSLNLLTGCEFDRSDIIKLLLTELSACYERFEADGIAAISDEYRTLCVNLGKAVSIHEKDTFYKATAIGISPDGALEVLLENGEKRALDSGEVSVRGIYGYI